MTPLGHGNWSEHGSDFASTLGAGGVPGTKFVWPDPGPKFKPVNLTSEKETQWKKWIGLYNEKMLSKGEFRDLYVYGYDVPEAYAIENGFTYAAIKNSKGQFVLPTIANTSLASLALPDLDIQATITNSIQRRSL